MQNIKISSFQFLVLVIFFSIGTSILELPSAIAVDVKQDAWIATIMGTIIGILVIWFFTKIASWFPNLTYVQLNEKILGKWFGKFSSILFVFLSLLYTASLLSKQGLFLASQLFPNTPILVITILMAIILVMGIRLGLETLARSAEILIFIFLFLFIGLVIFIIPEIKVHNLEPFFISKLSTMMKSSIMIAVISSVNAIVLLMIFPALINEYEKGRKSFFLGIIIGGIVIIIITVLCVFVLGSSTTARQIYPSYILARQINIGNFINRIEVIMAALWIICLYFKASIYFYAGTIGLAQIFNLKDYRPMTYPLGIIITVLSIIIAPNFISQAHFDSKTSISLSIVFFILVPLLLTIVYIIRKKQLKKSDVS
ncbi:endospore germination permease [Psychrobacillus sp. NPDC058041]|uniref:GerAB/ArcD/ProY family transporter n=1 Tax=Psychrobacillus sp. NPDC058041 TaxID=3346310 RepID=UPI0036DF78FD